MTDPIEGKQATKPSVLFVDDEESILAALRSSLRKERHRFDFRFAVGGAEALAQLKESPAAVIVSDMRMPGMNGVELLELARADCPEAVRIVLTGEAERELMMRSLPVVHQWLSKPCDRETLLTAIEGAVRYRERLSDLSLQQAVGEIDALASPPTIYTELLALAAEPTTSIAEIAAVVSADVAIAAKLVQLANSAFRGGSPVADLHGAIVQVGLNNLSSLVLALELESRWSPGIVIPGLDLGTNARSSEIAAAVAVDWVPEDRFAGLAALLHNVGLLIEAQTFPDRLAASYAAALETETSLVAYERGEYGVSHLDLAGHLLSIWGVPSSVVFAVVGSHEPMTETTPKNAINAVRLGVRVAQCRLGASIGAPHRAPTTSDELVLIERVLGRNASVAKESA